MNIEGEFISNEDGLTVITELVICTPEELNEYLKEEVIKYLIEHNLNPKAQSTKEYVPKDCQRVSEPLPGIIERVVLDLG